VCALALTTIVCSRPAVYAVVASADDDIDWHIVSFHNRIAILVQHDDTIFQAFGSVDIYWCVISRVVADAPPNANTGRQQVDIHRTRVTPLRHILMQRAHCVVHRIVRRRLGSQTSRRAGRRVKVSIDCICQVGLRLRLTVQCIPGHDQQHCHHKHPVFSH
jgi:hypothetical protein